jgi:DNA-binding GntR family transcriptional regulator
MASIDHSISGSPEKAELSSGAEDSATPQRRLTAATIAEEAIRAGVTSGEVALGGPVREEYWAGRLSLSRTPVREAIHRLVVEGLLIRDGRTAYVFQPSIDDLLDIYDMRLALETLAATRAMERAGATLADGFSELLDTMTKGPGSGGDWFVQHEKFHLYLYSGAGSSRLTSTIRTLRAQSEPYVRFASASRPRFRSKARSQHREMVDLVRSGDAVGLVELVRDHLTRSRRQVSVLIEEGWGTGAPFPVLSRSRCEART